MCGTPSHALPTRARFSLLLYMYDVEIDDCYRLSLLLMTIIDINVNGRNCFHPPGQLGRWAAQKHWSTAALVPDGSRHADRLHSPAAAPPPPPPPPPASR